MSLPYVLPEVTVTETSQGSSAASLITQENLCLVGLSAGGITVTDTITFADGPGGSVPDPTDVAATGSTTGGFLAATEYFYVVVATNASGHTTPSSEVNVTTTGTTGSVLVTWDASPGATGYQVWRGTVTATENVYYTVAGGNNTSFIDQGLVGTSGTLPVTNTATQPSQVPVVLPTFAANAGATLSAEAIISVTDALNPGLTAITPYQVTIDYIFDDSTGTITRTSTSRIPENGTVYVAYTYTPANYFDVTLYTDLAVIQQIYGNAFDPTGTMVNCPLSFAALNAFNNGTQQIYIAPLFVLEDASDPTSTRLQPTAAQAITASTAWSQTLTGLNGYNNIGVITPVVGQTSASPGPELTNNGMYLILSAVQDWINFVQTNFQQFVVMVAGEDGTAGVNGASNYPDKVTMRNHALSLQSKYGGNYSQNVVLINSSSYLFPMPSAQNPTQQIVGGQYVAAAIGGLLNVSSGNVAQTINQAAVGGFTAIKDFPSRTAADLQADAQAGLLVMIQPKGQQSVLVRHAITLDNNSYARRELNVVVSKFYMLTALVNYLASSVIGKITPPGLDSASYVGAQVTTVLEALQTAGVIAAYGNVAATVTNTNPLVVNVTFDYLPFFPIDYINISFSVDTTTGQVTNQTEAPTS